MSVLGTFRSRYGDSSRSWWCRDDARSKAALGEGAKLVAVTQLTSTSEEDMRDCQNIQTTVQESVVNYARKAQEAGLDGVVCSAHEVA